ERTLLVSSANLTTSGLDQNIEAGIVVRGGAAARRASEHLWALPGAGVLVRISSEVVDRRGVEPAADGPLNNPVDELRLGAGPSVAERGCEVLEFGHAQAVQIGGALVTAGHSGQCGAGLAHVDRGSGGARCFRRPGRLGRRSSGLAGTDR